VEREREQIILRGEIRARSNPPTGCRFHTRFCQAYIGDVCRDVEPELRELRPALHAVTLLRAHRGAGRPGASRAAGQLV